MLREKDLAFVHDLKESGQQESGLQESSGVILFHGIARTSRSLRRLEHALREAGIETLNLDYPSRKKQLDLLADHVHPAVSNFSGRHKSAIHFVGHSMGGLLARA